MSKEASLALNFISGIFTIILMGLINLDYHRFEDLDFAIYILLLNAAVSFVIASRYKGK